MKTKNYLHWLLLIPIGSAFVIISLLLYFNRGNSRKLIRAKLKTGAFLLSFSYFSACGELPGGSEIMCYDPELPKNYISLENIQPAYHPGDTINGGVNQPTFQQYSFKIIKNGETETDTKGWLVAVDSAFDGSYDPFYLIIPQMVTMGNYELKIYGEPTGSFTFTNELRSQAIEIINED
jgi:hypothetical protein